MFVDAPAPAAICDAASEDIAVPSREVYALREKSAPLRRACQRAMDKLGYPDENYPGPVAEAHRILASAINEASDKETDNGN